MGTHRARLAWAPSKSAKASSTISQPRPQPLGQHEQIGAADDPAVRVVGIDHHCDPGLREPIQRRRLAQHGACRREGFRMAAIGRRKGRRDAGRRDASQHMDQRLRAGTGDDGALRRAVAAGGGAFERRQSVALRQAGPGFGG